MGAEFSGPTWGKVQKWAAKEIDKAVVGGSTPLGSWNAATNTPPLPSSARDASFYDVVVAGTYDGETYEVGDIVKYSSTNGWYKVPTHVDVDSVKQYRNEAEAFKNVAVDKANQAENSATQAGTYATQSGNYAGEAMQARDDIKLLFFRGTAKEYTEAYHRGEITDETISFIKQDVVVTS